MQSYFNKLETKEIGKNLIYSKETTSTQIILNSSFSTLESHGLAYLTDIQTTGKGRGNNQWTSPAGCLMFSFRTIQTDGIKLPMVQYLVSLAQIKTIKSFSPALDVAIKWPNDLYTKRTTKIGGEL